MKTLVIRISVLVIAMMLGIAGGGEVQAQSGPQRASIDINGGDPNGSSTQVNFSYDGNFVVFTSEATDLVDVDTNARTDIFRVDLSNGQIIMVSINGSVQGASDSETPTVTWNGDSVAFESYSDFEGGSLFQNKAIWVKVISSNQLFRADVTKDNIYGNGLSSNADFSDNGNFVVFQSTSTNLVDTDVNGASDIFIKNLYTGDLELVSISSSGERGDGDSTYPSVSWDGRYVFFVTQSTNLVDIPNPDGFPILVMRDRQTGATIPVSLSDDGINLVYVQSPRKSEISSDGRYAVYRRSGDKQGIRRDMQAVGIENLLVTVDYQGNPIGGQSVTPLAVKMSPDGRYVAYESNANNVLGDGMCCSSVYQTYIHDLDLGVLSLATYDSNGDRLSNSASSFAFQGDGSKFAYSTSAAAIDTDLNGLSDVYIANWQAPPVETGFDPTVDGYGFDNHGAEADYQLYLDVFSLNDNWFTKWLYDNRYGPSLEGGLCYGMATSSILKYKDYPWVVKDQYAIDHWNDPLSTWGSPPVNADDLFTKGNTYDYLLRYHWAQGGLAIKKYRRSNKMTREETVNLLKADIDTGLSSPNIIDFALLSNGKPDWAHSVLPYSYSLNGDVVEIAVYDPNVHGQSSTLRFNTLTKDWEYIQGGQIVLSGSANNVYPTFKVTPISLLEEEVILPQNLTHNVQPAIQGVKEVFGNVKNAYVNVADVIGQKIGFLETGEYVELTDEISLIYEANGLSSYQFYSESTQDFTVNVHYTQPESGSIMHSSVTEGEGNIVVVDSNGNAGTTDQIFYNNEFGSQSYLTDATTLTTGTTGSKKIQVMGYDEDEYQSATLQDFTLNSGGMLYMTSGFWPGQSNYGMDMVISGTNASSYTVRMERPDISGSAFLATGIDYQPGEIHTISIDWSDPSKAIYVITRPDDPDYWESGYLDNELINDRQGSTIYLPDIRNED